MPAGNVSQAALGERRLSSGGYQNASELLRDGLRLIEHQEEQGKVRRNALCEAARVGVVDIEAGVSAR